MGLFLKELIRHMSFSVVVDFLDILSTVDASIALPRCYTKARQTEKTSNSMTPEPASKNL